MKYLGATTTYETETVSIDQLLSTAPSGYVELYFALNVTSFIKIYNFFILLGLIMYSIQLVNINTVYVNSCVVLVV